MLSKVMVKQLPSLRSAVGIAVIQINKVKHGINSSYFTDGYLAVVSASRLQNTASLLISKAVLCSH